MSEHRAMLVDTARKMFADAQTRGFDAIAEAGFIALLVPEENGGFGGDWGDLFAVLQVAGALVPDLPVGETIVAARLASDAGLALPVGPAQLHDQALGAFVRVGQAAGALDAGLAMTIDHANTRSQFGKPLSKFQAVQQNLAAFACEAAAVQIAGGAAAAALDRGDAEFEIAAAKLRTNGAIGRCVAIAHQVHGAIGFTQDYPLHRLTTALMAWRSDYGHDSHWASMLGGIAASHGGTGLWAEITRRGDG